MGKGRDELKRDEITQFFHEITKKYKNLFHVALSKDDPDYIENYIPPKKRRHRKLRLRLRPSAKK